MANVTRKMMSLIFACLLAFNLTISPAYAGSGYNVFHTYVGGVGMTMEVGFNGSIGYSRITATDYVDTLMDGKLY